MEFRILGPLEVVGDGRPVPVERKRERALLARLLLSANQVVSSDTLIEDLWSGAPTEGAGQALWVYVSRLRKTLRGHGGGQALITRPPGYMLRAEPEAVDACRFETLVERARQLSGAGDPAAAAAAFREALALWRGPALADVADAPFVRAEAARLEEARLAALEDRIDADLACGRHGALVGELTGLTRDHPLRERLWAQRMLALYRAGRQAEALRAYQDVRRHLGQELGIEPGEELRRLETAMLRHECGLDWSSRTEPDSQAAPVVSLLFTDVVGSTELLERLGDDAAHELRRRHFALLREAVAVHRGTAVKSLGDGLMAAFASPLAALRCAVAIQRAVFEERHTPDPALAVRIGLHAGEPIGEDDDYFGTPVVVAQRLCARARPGQILASSIVQGLIGNRTGCSFNPLGELTLKGFSEPVAACEIVWEEPSEKASLPLPLPLERESSVFVGRQEELRRLQAGWQDARAGRRELVLVAGEPGIGKTRLAAEFAKRAHASGGTVLFGRCDEGMGVPYQPFVEALALYLRQTPTPTLGRLAGELVRLVPEISEFLGDLPPPMRSDPETERYRLFDAVAAWLSALSTDTPAVLVIDDLHWASRPTLALLAHVLRSGEPLRLLVVATYRDTDPGISIDLTDALADLARQPGVDRIRLVGLGEAEVAAYMEAQARHELDDAGRALAATLHAGTAGNPFFVGQLLRHLAETEAIVRRDGRWAQQAPVFALGIPQGVRDVIARRLARLPVETGDLLALASVIGDRFELNVLSRASDEPEVSTLRALDPAITARLITEAGDVTIEYRFVHALVQVTLYDALSRARRSEFHHRAARALEAAHKNRLDDDVPTLAYHYARAGRDERPAAIHYATLAGDRAFAQQAHDDAVTYYRQALELLDTSDAVTSDPRRLKLLIGLGEAQRRSGNPASRETLLGAARLAAGEGDVASLVRAVLCNNRGFFTVVSDVDEERLDLLQTALGLVGDEPSAERAELLSLLATELTYTGDLEQVLRAADEAGTIAAHLDDVAVRARVGARRVFACQSAERAAAVAAEATDLVALADATDDPQLRVSARRPTAPQYVGALAEARRRTTDAMAIADESGQPALRSRVHFDHAGALDALGDHQKALRLTQVALELGQQGAWSDATLVYSGRMTVHWTFEGQPEVVLALAAQFLERRPAVAAWRGPWALGLALTRRNDELADFLTKLPDLLPQIPRDLFWLAAHFTLAIAQGFEVQDPASSAVLYDLLLPYRTLHATYGVGYWGPVEVALAVAARVKGDVEGALAHHEAAAVVIDTCGAARARALNGYQWARTLLDRDARGDRQHALSVAEDTLAYCQHKGYTTLVTKTVDLLADLH